MQEKVGSDVEVKKVRLLKYKNGKDKPYKIEEVKNGINK